MRSPDCQSLLARVAHGLPGGHHHLARPRLVCLPVLLQEAAQPVLLTRQEADPVLVNLHQSLESTCRFVDRPSYSKYYPQMLLNLKQEYIVAMYVDKKILNFIVAYKMTIIKTP